jgi:Acetoacetate decarboxylase (ADC)
MPTTPYISWIGHGATSLSIPADFTNATMHFFGTRADTAAMQRVTDALLNAASGGAVHYQAIAPVALFSFIDVERCTSAVDNVGWLPGRECAIWIPLLERETDNPFHLRLVLWAPYIFIDYAIGMITGREVWGWPKVTANISVDPDFVCSTTFFRTFDPTTRGETGPLYRIVRQGQPGQQPASSWRDGATAAAAIIGGLLGEIGGRLMNTLQLQPMVPSVCLKQFRDSASPADACYRAIVDSPVRITQFHGGNLLTDSFEVEITNCQSHQIVDDLLGQQPNTATTRLPVHWASRMSVDFQALPGKVIVRSA